MSRVNQSCSVEFKLIVIKIIEKESLSLMKAGLRFNIPNIAIISKWKKDFANFGIVGLKSKPKGIPISISDYKRKKRKSDKPLTREEELLLENERLRCENSLLKNLDALFKPAEIQAIMELRLNFDLETLLNQTNMAHKNSNQ